MRLALGIAYDGSGFCGWQSQPSACGVQDALELALAKIALHPIRCHAAGRTDTGVHGLGQVVHFDTDSDRPLSAWVRGVNAYLPSSVRVEWAQPVDDEFHARFSALERSYQYLLYNAPVSSALMASKAGWFHLPLNVDAMAEAASYLIGEHDFSAFRAAECQAKSPIRTMTKALVQTQGAYVVFDFSANAFLQHQVRNMVGTLAEVGYGRRPASWPRAVLLGADRAKAGQTAPPEGLVLTGVTYPEKVEWR